MLFGSLLPDDSSPISNAKALAWVRRMTDTWASESSTEVKKGSRSLTVSFLLARKRTRGRLQSVTKRRRRVKEENRVTISDSSELWRAWFARTGWLSEATLLRAWIATTGPATKKLCLTSHPAELLASPSLLDFPWSEHESMLPTAAQFELTLSLAEEIQLRCRQKKIILKGPDRRWIRIRCQIFKIQDGESNMADGKPKNPWFWKIKNTIVFYVKKQIETVSSDFLISHIVFEKKNPIYLILTQTHIFIGYQAEANYWTSVADVYRLADFGCRWI